MEERKKMNAIQTEILNINANEHSAAEVEVEEDETAGLPVKLQKIMLKMSELKKRIQEHKKEVALIYTEMSSTEKMFEKYVSKIAKEQTKAATEHRKRTPSGFARPTQVSSELCTFMGRPTGDLISRTETSKFLADYISANGLANPQKKSVIRPNEQLSRLLGDDARGVEITYFSMQKYINRHFIKNETGAKIYS